jgi:hypothetical protein
LRGAGKQRRGADSNSREGGLRQENATVHSGIRHA